MASLSGMVTGANTALGNALDKLKELKDNILGGFLSIPLVKTALVVAANIIIAVNILKIIKKLPAKISSLQTELLTIAGLAIGTAAYNKAFEKLNNSKMGQELIKQGKNLKEFADTTRDIVYTTSVMSDRARNIAGNIPNYFVNEVTGKVEEAAQNVLTPDDAPEKEELSELPLNTKMMALREKNKSKYSHGPDSKGNPWDKEVSIRPKRNVVEDTKTLV